ncbi:ComEA family DNA-binding protein [Mobilicoccus pelagius]|uniref:Helix-hairpin-helix DNA-binding motif class 1 domain-containing protein n=1 Tax=Mobilicoccus pelagius NBRC 104925 TaxID=1089455 RepID=H5UNV0_9MICO|nr:ComEA family DNA-binding protein [Mobilicoccus pelagius]GAB47408.1 hypothetical protein MOPEL_009_00990 [Mobilicoccus pelagius NBRC 104925]
MPVDRATTLLLNARAAREAADPAACVDPATGHASRASSDPTEAAVADPVTRAASPWAAPVTRRSAPASQDPAASPPSPRMPARNGLRGSPQPHASTGDRRHPTVVDDAVTEPLTPVRVPGPPTSSTSPAPTPHLPTPVTATTNVPTTRRELREQREAAGRRRGIRPTSDVGGAGPPTGTHGNGRDDAPGVGHGTIDDRDIGGRGIVDEGIDDLGADDTALAAAAPVRAPASGGTGVGVGSRTGRGDTPAETALPSSRLVRGRDGVLEIPSGLVGARVVPPWLAVAGAGVVVLVAVLAVTFSFLRDEPASEPVATQVRPSSPAAVTGTAGRPPVATPVPVGGAALAEARPGATAPVAAGGAPGATPAGEYLVHVVGEVKREGVVTVPTGARVSDAIAKAGGPGPKAVLAGLNLARPVVDGEQIVVPDADGAPVPVNTMPPPAMPQPGAAPGVGGPLIDLNTADQAALESLPGVGPVLAAKILEWRTTHGRFTSVDELGEVSGVGEKKLEAIRPKVRV